MNSGQKFPPARDYIFRGFLLGAGIGAASGLVAVAVWGGYGPHKVQIPIAFWALVGGSVGLIAGILRRLIRGE